jgi:hypothetical protein
MVHGLTINIDWNNLNHFVKKLRLQNPLCFYVSMTCCLLGFTTAENSNVVAKSIWTMNFSLLLVCGSFVGIV